MAPTSSPKKKSTKPSSQDPWRVRKRNKTTQVATKKECSSCARELAKSTYPAKPISERCDHEVTVCRSCTTKWLSSEVEKNDLYNIGCVECQVKLSSTEIEARLPNRPRARFRFLYSRKELEKQPGWRWCLSSKCNSGQVHEDNQGDIFKCMSCKYAFCTKCDHAEHAGMSCDGAKTAENAASQQLRDTISKQCPNCQAHIEKNGGCNHMKCFRCGCDFCFSCLVTYKEIDERGLWAHGEGCPEFVALLRPMFHPQLVHRPAPVQQNNHVTGAAQNRATDNVNNNPTPGDNLRGAEAPPTTPHPETEGMNAAQRTAENNENERGGPNVGSG